MRSRSRLSEHRPDAAPERGSSGFLGAGELRPSIRPVLVLLDAVAVLGAALVVDPTVSLVPLGVAVAATLWVNGNRDLHRSRLTFSVLEEVPSYLFASVVAAVALVAARSMLGHAPEWRFAVAFGVAHAVLTGLLRITVYATVHALRRRRRIAHPAVVVGADSVGIRLAMALRDHPEHGLQPMGLIESDPDLEPRELPLPVLGTLADLPLVLTDLQVQDVVFAHPGPPDELTASAVRACLQQDCQVFVVPRFYELMGLNHPGRVEPVHGIPLLRLRRWPLRPHRVLAKRLVDIVVALVMLVLLSPVMLVCAVAVRLESGPGVLFRQERIGIGGRPFTLLKFRSLRPGSELEGATTWSIDHDDRVGPVGRFLRRTSLDELPQLLNVLRGDMSLVGPRPERPHFVDQFSMEEERYHERHRMPTGLTGWAQVNNLRGDTSIGDRVRFDNYYIENWTLWGDVKILIRTIVAVLRRQPTSRRGLRLIGPPVGGPPETPHRGRRRDRREPRSYEVRTVLHVSKPTTEGVANVLLGYVHDQLARGWRVAVACPEDGWLAAEAAAAGAEVHPWEATRDPGPGLLGETRRLRRIIAAVRPDVLHLHSAKAGLAGRLAVRGRVRTVYQPHGWSFLAARGAVAAAARRWEQAGARWTDLLVCVSDAELVEANEVSVRGRAIVVPNGLDSDAFPFGWDPSAARQQLGLPDVPTAVCLGRLAHQKGQDRLLAVWPDVRASVPDAQLLLVGDGPERESLEAVAPEGVTFLGNQSDPAQWLAAADVVVVPSRWEGMALAPLEALATGRSVVGFDVIGLRESLPAESAGLVPDDQLDVLAHAVAQRLADPALARAEGDRGREHVRRWHDASWAAALVAEAYRRPASGVDINRVLVGPGGR
jgi:exopolysaccharide biosynthesis polyprenyl glycosylphosphotransferase